MARKSGILEGSTVSFTCTEVVGVGVGVDMVKGASWEIVGDGDSLIWSEGEENLMRQRRGQEQDLWSLCVLVLVGLCVRLMDGRILANARSETTPGCITNAHSYLINQQTLKTRF